MTCAHEDFHADVDVCRIAASDTDPTIIGYAADIRVRCAVCGERFVFIGAPIGVMPSKPTMSANGDELRAPLRPQSSDPHFGLGLPGVIARIRAGDTSSSN